jgi:hypothetical protein
MLIICIILISILIITGITLYIINRYKRKRAETLGIPTEPEGPEIPEECCGQHEVCE